MLFLILRSVVPECQQNGQQAWAQCMGILDCPNVSTPSLQNQCHPLEYTAWHLAPDWLQKLTEGWLTVNVYCLLGSTPDFLFGFTPPDELPYLAHKSYLPKVSGLWVPHTHFYPFFYQEEWFLYVRGRSWTQLSELFEMHVMGTFYRWRDNSTYPQHNSSWNYRAVWSGYNCSLNLTFILVLRSCYSHFMTLKQ